MKGLRHLWFLLKYGLLALLVLVLGSSVAFAALAHVQSANGGSSMLPTQRTTHVTPRITHVTPLVYHVTPKTTGTITEYPLPNGNVPQAITNGPNQTLWFSDEGANAIVKFTPKSDKFSAYRIPTSNADVEGITKGPDGNIWFTEYGGNNIGKLTPTGTFTEYPIPTSFCSPYGIVAGLDGNLWFVEQSANQIGRITTSGVNTEYHLPGSISYSPIDITNGPKGTNKLWFTLQYYPSSRNAQIGSSNTIDQIGSINSSTDIIHYYADSMPGSQPSGITDGIGGTQVYTDNSDGDIGVVSYSDGYHINEYPTPTPNSNPYWIAEGAGGNDWFTETSANAIGEFNAKTQAFQEFPIPSANAYPWGITAGAFNAMWFVESGTNELAEIATI
jgi:virginiamycin B lyase